jgi:hypothetical protein
VARRQFSIVLWMLALSMALAGASLAQTLLQQEPGPSMLRPGETVLVDDHSCAKGQIKEVTGGNNRKYDKDVEKPGTPRLRHCVPRP